MVREDIAGASCCRLQNHVSVVATTKLALRSEGILTTSVATRTRRGQIEMDLFSSLLAENIIWFDAPIDDDQS